MQKYLNLLRSVRDHGIVKISAPRGLRTTPIETRSLFCETFRHDMSLGFPLLTTKKMNFRNIVAELLWFLSGSPDVRPLNAITKIWEPWMNKDGQIPSAYGVRWRGFIENSYIPDGDDGYGAAMGGVVDQIRGVIDLLKRDPSSRRGVVVAWDPRCDLASALPPCHYTFVVNILDGKVNLHVTMRSTDVPVGLPYNIASYGILLHLFALWLNCGVGELAITMVDCHIYGDQLHGVATQLERGPLALPELVIPQVSLEDISLDLVDDFKVVGYQSYPFIHFPVAL